MDPSSHRFSEGIFVDYRWFDVQTIEPTFPCAKFEYSGPKIESAKDGRLDVSFRLCKSGAVAGDEVLQVYLEVPENPQGCSPRFAVRTLRRV